MQKVWVLSALLCSLAWGASSLERADCAYIFGTEHNLFVPIVHRWTFDKVEEEWGGAEAKAFRDLVQPIANRFIISSRGDRSAFLIFTKDMATRTAHIEYLFWVRGFPRNEQQRLLHALMTELGDGGIKRVFIGPEYGQLVEPHGFQYTTEGTVMCPVPSAQ